MLLTPRRMLASPVLCVVSLLSFCCVALLNGGGGVLCVVPLVLCCPRPLHSVPCLRIISGAPHCLVLSCVAFSRVVLSRFFFVLLCCCVVVCVRGMGGWCVWCVWSYCECCISFLLPPVFVFAVTALLVWCCVFVTGLCRCGIAVMIVVGAERRGVWCVVSTLYVLWCVFQCVVLLCCGLWNGGCV